MKRILFLILAILFTFSVQAEDFCRRNRPYHTGNLTIIGGGILTGWTTLPADIGSVRPLTSLNDAALFVRDTANSSGVTIGMWKSRSTDGTADVVVQDNDVLGTIGWRAGDGAQFETSAQIFARVNGTPGADDVPAEIVFATASDGTKTVLERWGINSSGELEGLAGGSNIKTATNKFLITTDGTGHSAIGFWNGGVLRIQTDESYPLAFGTANSLQWTIAVDGPLAPTGSAVASMPSTCTVGAIWKATDSDDCSAGSGNGALCVCNNAGNGWVLLLNY